MLQPIAQSSFPLSQTGLPRHVELTRAAFGSREDSALQTALSRQQVIELTAAGKEQQLLDDAYDAYERYCQRHKLVVIGGTHAGAHCAAASSAQDYLQQCCMHA